MIDSKRIGPCLVISTFAIGLGLTGCGANKSRPQQQEARKYPPLEQLSSAQDKQKLQAIKAKDKLFQSLLGELTASMGEKGPAKSISVCKTRAPEIAAAVSKEMNVRIGRTSFKLRNGENKPPHWARHFVSDQMQKPVEVKLPDNGLGVLLPIRLKVACTVCHGQQNQVSPDVQAAILTNYPNDKATGFSEGDLRGYFWVEVPSPADAPQ